VFIREVLYRPLGSILILVDTWHYFSRVTDTNNCIRGENQGQRLAASSKFDSLARGDWESAGAHSAGAPHANPNKDMVQSPLAMSGRR